MSIHKQHIWKILFILYSIILLYFSFFGFHRITAGVIRTEYFYNIIPSGIPLWIPKYHTFSDIDYFMLWFFSFSNLAAFIPFGIGIPLLYQWSFKKCILIFIGVITSIEILQMLTYIGSFDIHDILINTIGVIIGYISYMLSQKYNMFWKKVFVFILSLVVQIIGIYLLAEFLDFIKNNMLYV